MVREIRRWALTFNTCWVLFYKDDILPFFLRSLTILCQCIVLFSSEINKGDVCCGFGSNLSKNGASHSLLCWSRERCFSRKTIWLARDYLGNFSNRTGNENIMYNLMKFLEFAQRLCVVNDYSTIYLQIKFSCAPYHVFFHFNICLV
jgi:hypothetical protein